MTPKFSLWATVKIPVLNEKIEGRVIGIWIAEQGIQYKVRYFWAGKAEEVYFFEDELEAR